MNADFQHVIDLPDDRGPAGTIVALHGTGGDETSLIAWTRSVAPSAHILGVRGRSAEEGITRFFRRFDAVTYDQDHIAQEADALAQFVTTTVAKETLPQPVIALGYSNGANIALAMMARNPNALAAMALLRPVMPLDDPPTPDLSEKHVLVVVGEADQYRPYADHLLTYLRDREARMQAVDLAGVGHGLGAQDRSLVEQWLKTLLSRD